MLTRRSFLKLTGATTLAWYVATQTGWMEWAVAQIPGGTLNPDAVPKFQTPMLIPPVMPRAATITMPGGKPADYYEISMKQFDQQILPASMPATTVWGYGAKKSATSQGLVNVYHAPSLTIESTWKRPVRIKWINELVDANNNYLPHLLPVDPTLHWANPPGGTDGRDMRPTFTETPGRYTGPVSIVTHLHGAAGVGDESDGYADRLPGPGDQAAVAVHQPRPVRLALPHRRARGQRNDAPLPHRIAPARPTDIAGSTARGPDDLVLNWRLA